MHNKLIHLLVTNRISVQIVNIC